MGVYFQNQADADGVQLCPLKLRYKRLLLNPGCYSTCWHKTSTSNILGRLELDLNLRLLSPSLNQQNHSNAWDLEMNPCYEMTNLIYLYLRFYYTVCIFATMT